MSRCRVDELMGSSTAGMPTALFRLRMFEQISNRGSRQSLKICPDVNWHNSMTVNWNKEKLGSKSIRDWVAAAGGK